MLLTLVAFGVHIAIALGATSMLGIYLITGNVKVVQSMVASTAYEALRDYVFAVIPLFMLMGEFIGKSGAVTDVYLAINRGVRRLPGRLALATIMGNAVFSFVTGVSIASAATFSRIAYPQMKAFGYHRGYALGTIAGSSCLGMLIPPSVLMIVWGILTEESIGRIFLAGVLPGLLLVSLFVAYVLISAIIKPELTGNDRDTAILQGDSNSNELMTESSPAQAMVSLLGIVLIIVAVLGGIWLGFFTPTEGAGVGAVIALLLAVVKGLRPKQLIESILSVGRTSAPILLLLLTAALYSRVLAMTGISGAISEFFLSSGLAPWQILGCMVLVWFLLGTVIDSISIILLTVPIFAPLAQTLGYDPVAFAILGILAIEAGLLTPPFGLLVYTVKSAIDDDVSIGQIFISSIPYWIIMLLCMTALAVFPGIATFLPNLVY